MSGIFLKLVASFDFLQNEESLSYLSLFLIKYVNKVMIAKRTPKPNRTLPIIKKWV
ncbi:hypothetical protein [Cytobacillus purgationiresistens]|uniref:Uncharacterized protein n=1 Tax=Cytobacillus purgationiresistens TaxID=863449 RepID=A0ABU0AKB8_9BACI|nr:hypothetical protein [Cytobacillus purgationiresistens]MDQ0271697.1 hypothetical protein [Cytobacillus purgationiresistens]